MLVLFIDIDLKQKIAQEDTTMAEDKTKRYANELSVDKLDKVTGGATIKQKPDFKNLEYDKSAEDIINHKGSIKNDT